MTKIIKVQKPKFTGELEIIENLEDILEDIFNDEKIFNKIIENEVISDLDSVRVSFESCIFRNVSFENCNLKRLIYLMWYLKTAIYQIHFLMEEVYTELNLKIVN